MDKDKAVFQHYLKTKILGAYETAEIDIVAENSVSGFDDADTYFEDSQATISRSMCIQGSVFRVHSVFSAAATATPTEKFITLIDTELEKESRTA